MDVWPRIESLVAEEGACVLVTVLSTRGSVPREAGARMLVRPDGRFHGTIGGGTLEWQALAEAQRMLARRERMAATRDEALGPNLGQCCGGQVTLGFELYTAANAADVAPLAAAERRGPFRTATVIGEARFARTILPDGQDAPRGGLTETFGDRLPVIGLFGAGHVGKALVLALAPLPLSVVWHDERPGAFPAVIAGVVTCLSGPSEEALGALPDGAQVLVMTHSHALDLALVAAALRSERFPHVGLIGSATKRARFMSRLADMGLAAEAQRSLRCPIGIAGLAGKEPAVIAASVAAECLILAQARSINSKTAARRTSA
ncbi:xanthine dehydrogenase accessory protein XdhC [Phreatobacter sp.]|uniref:xanthine dehydrogenase accessory protein XdhC n=1 Tax=Phreatobacter sp. TaxID=1966341 RepID=UPI0022BD9B27|nr:xanthine dehydrogenase accessory protein XdhC [Phreatobacter sp.]MCZ8316316.1 xanthine dehydrogenase accessory protein XdhC [Phreatobacter sp.]